MLPNFVFIGPTKSGTSWIDTYLRARNEVVLPLTLKETVFFDKRFHKGLEWYESHFSDGRQGVCVEVAPTLFGKPEAAKRLAQILPTAHVICTLKNPIDRAVSHYFHYLKCGVPDVGFERMVEMHKDIIHSGLYYQNLRVWLDLLGNDRVHVLLEEEMRANLNGFCEKMCKLLDIPFIAPSSELSKAFVNEASVPKFKALARLTRFGADELRGLGAGYLVGKLNLAPLKKLVFGPVPSSQHKQEIRRQALQYSDVLLADIEKLEEMIGIKLPHWRMSAEARTA
jgi:hypothetical protein